MLPPRAHSQFPALIREVTGVAAICSRTLHALAFVPVPALHGDCRWAHEHGQPQCILSATGRAARTQLQRMGCFQLRSSMRIKAGSPWAVPALVHHFCSWQHCPQRRNAWAALALHLHAARLHLCSQP